MSTVRGMGAHFWVLVESDSLEKMHLIYDDRIQCQNYRSSVDHNTHSLEHHRAKAKQSCKDGEDNTL